MIPLQQQTDMDAIVGLTAYVLGGLAFGGVSYITNNDAEFRLRQLVKTLAIYGIAGAIVYAQGGDLSEPELVAATALSAPVANQLIDYFFSPTAGGSATKGRGTTP